ncbi:DUF4430 domain-containing protein [Candidatus Saccharibacteria bacterium]|nr:DUF4430 domain-containing protein [Candidatus Saccharibacteria bacterium]
MVNEVGSTSKKSMEESTCGCVVCEKFCKRYRKVHPIFASIVFIIVIAASFGALAVVAKSQANDIANLKTQVSELQLAAKSDDVRQNGVSYEGKDGKTALALLKKKHAVETKEFTGMGEFVTAIDGVKAEDGKNFWAFYVDGEMATEGASTYETKSGEKIEWRLEDIQ